MICYFLILLIDNLESSEYLTLTLRYFDLLLFLCYYYYYHIIYIILYYKVS